MKPIRLSSIIFTGLFLSGCISNSNNSASEIRTIDDAESKLAQIISDKACDATFQCRVVAYGERACGGPSRFDIYSIKTSKHEEVEFLANEITLFEKSYNKSKTTFSTCEHTIAPQTLCIANTCEPIERKR